MADRQRKAHGPDTSALAERLRRGLAGRRIVYTTSWDDGLTSDRRLVELGQRHGVPMMIFASPQHHSGKAMPASDLREVAQYAEIGSHTLRHSPIDNCSVEDACEHVLSGRRHLEQILDRDVPHFCLVGGRYTRTNLAAVSTLVDSLRTTDLLNFGSAGAHPLVEPSLQIRFSGRTHPAKVLWSALRRLTLPERLVLPPACWAERGSMICSPMSAFSARRRRSVCTCGDTRPTSTPAVPGWNFRRCSRHWSPSTRCPWATRTSSRTGRQAARCRARRGHEAGRCPDDRRRRRR